MISRKTNQSNNLFLFHFSLSYLFIPILRWIFSLYQTFLPFDHTFFPPSFSFVLFTQKEFISLGFLFPCLFLYFHQFSWPHYHSRYLFLHSLPILFTENNKRNKDSPFFSSSLLILLIASFSFQFFILSPDPNTSLSKPFPKSASFISL